MKRLIQGMCIISFLVYPSICTSSYLIQLTNDTSFITNQYWEENGQIKFYLYGGIVGIEKHRVRKITESELPYVIEEPQQNTQATVPEKVADPSGPETEKEAVLIKKKALVTKIGAISAAFREAKAKNDRKQMEAQRKKLLALKTELLKLQNELKQAYQGQLPPWWNE